MTTPTSNQGKLQQAKAILKARGMKPQDYNHLGYREILKLAGVKNE
jgi:hypothetical protein